MGKKVVITGIGVISAIGNNHMECMNAFGVHETGIGKVRYLNTIIDEFPVGEVKLSNEEIGCKFGISGWENKSRNVLLGISALMQTLDDSGLRTNEKSIALVSGTTVGKMDKAEYSYLAGDELAMLHNSPGSATEDMADFFNCFDFIATPSTACSSSLNAIIMGYNMIKCGMRDVVVAGGTECLTLFHLNGFKSLMILDEDICRPFDKNRNGLNLGEGAAFIVLESEESALKRNARIYGELVGTGNACDAFHQTGSSANGEGAYMAMSKAVMQAGLEPSDIDYVNAHGTGTLNNDASESAALSRLFGSELPDVGSTKSYTGHTTSASGSIETVFSLLFMNHGFVPETYGYNERDQDCIVPCKAKSKKMNYVMCNSFGFGGNDSSIILGRYGE